MKKRYRLLLSIIILTISIALLIWGYAPNPHERRVRQISPSEMQLAASAIPETRLLTLEFPSKMLADPEGDIVRLMLEVNDQGNEVVGETAKNPDLYETHNVTAEAQLDMAGMQIQPAGAIYEPLKRGQSTTFYWNIRAQEPGIYPGTVWLHLNFEDKSTGEKSRIAVSAQIIEIEAGNFFGLPVDVARALGIIGIVIGGVIGFPFVEDFFKLLFKKKQ